MKFLRWAGYALAAIVLLLCFAAAYVKLALPDTGPAPDLKIEKTAARVERGKYLSNYVTVCMDCHSSRDWSRFAGPMMPAGQGAGGERFDQQMGFPGTFYAPNITPYALSGWTDGELFRAITTGVSKDGRALFPVMGYHRFGQMDEEDIFSIIAYIRTLPPVKKDVPASRADFPVNFIINTMPAKAALTRKPDTTNVIAYGKYLVNATGCVDCHSKTDKGSVIAGTEFGGGMEFKSPGGVLISPNITMHRQTGIGNWTASDFVSRFKAFTAPGYVSPPVPESQPNTPMPWTMYAGMKESDLKAIYAYLKTVKSIENRVERYRKE
ncbi:MAG: cytochrome C [Dyadobacter sp. 50-39]|uniref:c-type cytochrome n=1 Tax=Dyadobacter sp. 50-39 TaxID=1895756 RepID=UPI000959C326|nr:c-type cytochrome [Dyadobacter sp. 50-39]OJV14808.1 MAG: cytochrome C [Dyadobacter sp. 50-39]